MAVTANQLIAAQCPGTRIPYPVLQQKRLYQGTMAFIDASTGAATDDDDSGANAFAGIVVEEVDNSAGGTGDKYVECYTTGVFELPKTSAVQADVGKKAYATDNYTTTPTAASATRIGNYVRLVSTTKLAVQIRVGDQTDEVAEAG